MLKKTALAMLSFVVHSVALAGTVGPAKEVCVSKNVIVPCEIKRWSFGVQGLYVQPIFQGFPDTVGSPTAGSTLGQPNANWNGAYRLEGIYHRKFGNDIGMSYLHFNNGTHRPNQSGVLFSGLPSVAFNWGLETRFDQVNLTMGQYFLMDCDKHAHVYAGLQYARFRIDSENWYLNRLPLPILGLTTLELRREIDYNGLGPVLGLDLRYDLPYGFSVGASGSGTVLFGSSRFSGALVARPSGLISAGLYSSKKSIVPGLESKLRLNYTCKTTEGLINIEGGYQVINYFNLPRSRWPLELANVTTDTMFGLQGPYAGVKWVGPL